MAMRNDSLTVTGFEYIYRQRTVYIVENVCANIWLGAEVI